jgi:hypothetical protein
MPIADVRKVPQQMDEISQEMLEERYRSWPFAKPMDEFCRRWLEANCDSDDLRLMKAQTPMLRCEVREFLPVPSLAALRSA